MRRRLVLLSMVAVLALVAFAVIFGKLQSPRHASKRQNAAVLRADRIVLDRLKDASQARKRGDLALAEAIYREVYEKLPNDMTLYQLAITLRDEGKLAEAKECMKHVVTPNSQHDSTLAREAMVLAEYAELCEQAGDFEGAKFAYERMGAKDRYEADVMAAKGARWREDYAAEVKFYKHALSERPNDAAVKSALEKAEGDVARQVVGP